MDTKYLSDRRDENLKRIDAVIAHLVSLRKAGVVRFGVSYWIDEAITRANGEREFIRQGLASGLFALRHMEDALKKHCAAQFDQ